MPFSDAQNYDYSNWTIVYSSQLLQDTSDQIMSRVNEIIKHLESIISTLESLNLSWVGQSQQLANTYNQEWQAALVTLFGTSKNPEKGVLVQLASAIASAASNYATAESWGEAAYGQFLTAILQPSGSTSNPPPSVTNPPGQIITAITETF